MIVLFKKRLLCLYNDLARVKSRAFRYANCSSDIINNRLQSNCKSYLSNVLCVQAFSFWEVNIFDWLSFLNHMLLNSTKYYLMEDSYPHVSAKSEPMVEEKVISHRFIQRPIAMAWSPYWLMLVSMVVWIGIRTNWSVRWQECYGYQIKTECKTVFLAKSSLWNSNSPSKCPVGLKANFRKVH